jgi:hypothetical protein
LDLPVWDGAAFAKGIAQRLVDPFAAAIWCWSSRVVVYISHPVVFSTLYVFGQAAMKLLYLVLNHAAQDWKRPPREWSEAKTQFAVIFGERFVI